MQDNSKRRRNVDRSADTKARLIAAARKLFVEKGFSGTSTPEIVRQAEVTRGALYHHYADKTALFRAVLEAESDAIGHAIEAIDKQPNPLAAGSAAYFSAMAVPGRARLLLVEGPFVLGAAEIDAMDGGGGRASLRAGLAAAVNGFSETEIDALAMILSAGFDRAALAIAEGAAPEPYHVALQSLIEGIRAQ
ncbi:MAG: helix-turn-helix domain-containing protein [Pseudomonadota bacterium]